MIRPAEGLLGSKPRNKNDTRAGLSRAFFLRAAAWKSQELEISMIRSGAAHKSSKINVLYKPLRNSAGVTLSR
jgi:hypothetical protein